MSVSEQWVNISNTPSKLHALNVSVNELEKAWKWTVRRIKVSERKKSACCNLLWLALLMLNTLQVHWRPSKRQTSRYNPLLATTTTITDNNNNNKTLCTSTTQLIFPLQNHTHSQYPQSWSVCMYIFGGVNFVTPIPAGAQTRPLPTTARSTLESEHQSIHHWLNWRMSTSLWLDSVGRPVALLNSSLPPSLSYVGSSCHISP